MTGDFVLPKNEALDFVVQCDMEKIYRNSGNCFTRETSTIRYRFENKLLTHKEAAVELFQLMLIEDLKWYEQYFRLKDRKVSRTDYLAHLRAIISGERNSSNEILEYRVQHSSPEQLKSCLYPVVRRIPTTLGDWWADDEPLLRAVVLRCFSKTSAIHEFIANIRVSAVEKELGDVKEKYKVLKNTTPALSNDYQTLTKQLEVINKQLIKMQEQLQQKDSIISELNKKITELEESNQHLQNQLSRLISNQKTSPQIEPPRKQVSFLAHNPQPASILPPTQA